VRSNIFGDTSSGIFFNLRACNNCAKGNQSECFNEQCVPADGYERGYQSVNRQLPGPGVQVCQDDIVVVDVENDMV
jgi:hypothetical protein